MNNITSGSPHGQAEIEDAEFSVIEEPATKARPADRIHPDVQAALDKVPEYVAKLHAANPLMWLAQEMESKYRAGFMYKHLHSDAGVAVAIRFSSLAEAADALKWLAAERGMHQIQKMWQYDQDKSLNWVFKGFRLSGHFSDPNAQCKFVQTGTKTVPVFEMRCDGADSIVTQGAPKLEAPAVALEGMPF